MAKHCFGTDEAIRIAEEVKLRIPDVQINLRILDDMPAQDAAVVSATPAYYLNGRLLFLGNPRVEELVARIAFHSQQKGENDD